jgi:hypothetical protein
MKGQTMTRCLLALMAICSVPIFLLGCNDAANTDTWMPPTTYQPDTQVSIAGTVMVGLDEHDYVVATGNGKVIVDAEASHAPMFKLGQKVEVTGQWVGQDPHGRAIIRAGKVRAL